MSGLSMVDTTLPGIPGIGTESFIARTCMVNSTRSGLGIEAKNPVCEVRGKQDLHEVLLLDPDLAERWREQLDAYTAIIARAFLAPRLRGC